MMMLESDKQHLIAQARKVMQKAYAPYSNYAVGAALLSKDGRVFTGCNVENASYGLTICAERSAVVSAVAQGVKDFSALAIAAGGSLPYPCGACRQVLFEFAPDLLVMVCHGDTAVETTLSALLPNAFGPKSL